MGNDNSKTTCDKSHVFRQEWQAANIIGIHEIINQRVQEHCCHCTIYKYTISEA